MKSYPIWNRVQACIYKSEKSYGAKRNSQVDVLVGTSAKNSHHFVSHCVTCRDHEDGSKEFRFYVSELCVARAIVKDGVMTRERPPFAIVSNETEEEGAKGIFEPFAKLKEVSAE